jgi:diguanylate cyclase (GGDEF)-like protein/PAS domain S-box-containing protein
MSVVKPDDLQTSPEESALWLEILTTALRNHTAPADWPVASAENQNWRDLVEEILSISQFTKSLADGNLSGELHLRGRLAGYLKALQANLRHLTWQVQQVAGGNLSQRVEFMGDFSGAFNQMTAKLAQARAALQTSEARYRSVVEASPDAITIIDTQGLIGLISPAAINMFGLDSPEDAIGKHFLEFIAQEEHERAQDIVSFVLKDNLPGENEFHAARKDGSQFDIGIRSRAILDADDRPAGVVIIARDITQRKMIEKAVADQRNLAEALRDVASALNSALSLEQIIDIVLENLGRVVAHDTLDIMLIESGYARVVSCTGYDDLIPGSQAVIMQHRFSLTETINLRAMMESHQIYQSDDIGNVGWKLLDLTGKVRSYLGAPILIEDQVVGFLGLLSSKSNFFTSEDGDRLMAFANLTAAAIEKARLIEKLIDLATTDSLTGAANRREFFIRGENELKRAARYDESLAVLILDLDHLKLINDTYGHSVGDLALKEFARVCKSCVREIDLVARFGGDEFVILLPKTTAAQALAFSERLRQQIADLKFSTHTGPIGITASIGIGEYRKNDTLQILIERADRGLYQAKETGRNQVVLSMSEQQDPN